MFSTPFLEPIATGMAPNAAIETSEARAVICVCHRQPPFPHPEDYQAGRCPFERRRKSKTAASDSSCSLTGNLCIRNSLSELSASRLRGHQAELLERVLSGM